MLPSYMLFQTQGALLLRYENSEPQTRFITLFYTETAYNPLPEGLFFSYFVLMFSMHPASHLCFQISQTTQRKKFL